MADDYQMLEELGSGSFGVVYKAVEKSTGELVAIKHVCEIKDHHMPAQMTDTLDRLTSREATTTYAKFSRRFLCSARARATTSPATRPASCVESSCGSSWSFSAVDHVSTWSVDPSSPVGRTH